ncbi:MAG: hypothetical protein NTW19_02595 [Planctomycetota bacterium]|nr:hypothetical protein [Planctomycetota bacterium]
MKPTAAALAEAKRKPNGWVYAIEGNFGPNDGVPPTAIIGAWKVNENGEIVGEFLPNPNYRAAASKQSQRTPPSSSFLRTAIHHSIAWLKSRTR